MRDENIYSKDQVWTDTQAACADVILTDIIRHGHDLTNLEVLEKAIHKIARRITDEEDPVYLDLMHAVWNRLHNQYPHMFAVAQEKGTLDTLNLDGTVISDDPANLSISQVCLSVLLM